MGIYVLTHAKGELEMVGPFKASTTVASIQQAQIWCSKWASENTKDGELPQWWIVERDVAEGVDKIEIPLAPPA